jgi:hypothetical protein
MSDVLNNQPKSEEEYRNLIKLQEKELQRGGDTANESASIAIDSKNLAILKEKTLAWLQEHANENSNLFSFWKKDMTWQQVFERAFNLKLI